jgi:hypothetical protein
MAEPKRPNDSSDMEPAEGSRDAVNLDIDDQEAEERYDEDEGGGDQGGGITNRPLGEEIENQRDVPPRGHAKPGGHAS